MSPHNEIRLVLLLLVVVFAPRESIAAKDTVSEVGRRLKAPRTSSPPGEGRRFFAYSETPAENARALNRRPGTKTETQRALLQSDADDDDLSSAFECRLRGLRWQALLRSRPRVWRLSDATVRDDLQNDLQALINCTRPGNVIAFATRQSIRLASRVIVPWPLTFTADVEEPDLVDGLFPRSPRKAQITCPLNNEGLFLVQVQNVTFANIIFEGCSLDSVGEGGHPLIDVIECRSHGTDGTIRLHHVTFRDNALGEKMGLRIRSPSCSRTEMISVRFENNTCSGQVCGALLSSESRIENSTISRNRLADARGGRPSIYQVSPDAHAIIVGMEASHNEITVLHASDASLSLSESRFVENSIETVTDEDPLSPCLRLTRSSARIQNSVFQLNRATSGAVVYAIRSNISASSSRFEENSAAKGSVLFLENQSSVVLHTCTFTSNHATDEGGAIFASESHLYASHLRFLNNSAAERGGSFHAESCNMTIRRCQFEDGSAARGGFLSVRGSIVNVSRSDFVNGSGTDGGCAVAEDESQIYLRDASLQFCAARQHGGAVYLESHSSIGVEHATMVADTAVTHGNVFYARSSEIVVKSSLAANNTQAVNGGFAFCTNNSRVELSDSTFEANAAVFGGVLYMRLGDTAHINNCLFAQNTATQGGGAVYIEQGTLLVNQSRFVNGTAHHSSYIAAFLSEVVISNSSMRNASATAGGCISIHGGSAVTVQNSSLLGCKAEGPGAAIYMPNGTLTIRSSVISDCFSERGYGNIACFGDSQIDVNDSVFARNKVYAGGAIMVQDGASARAIRCEFHENTVEGPGGSLFVERANASCYQCRFYSSRALSGGSAFVANGQVAFTDCFFANGSSQIAGGSLTGQNGGQFLLQNVTMIGNVAPDGGALNLESGSAATIINSTFLRNRATGDGGVGGVNVGGAINAVTAAVVGQGMNVFENVATNGGGIACIQGCHADIRQSDFHGNSAETGGAALVSNFASAMFLSTSFDQNAASHSGGVAQIADSRVQVINCSMNGNRADTGGGFGIFFASLNMSNAYFINGSATSFGGFISALGHPPIYLWNVTVAGARATQGGAIYFEQSVVTAESLHFIECDAILEGGAVHGLNSTLICNDCIFENNTAGQAGGAVSMHSFPFRQIALQSDQCVFRHNRARRGGGLHLVNTVRSADCSRISSNCSCAVLTGTQFTENMATLAGGGLFTSNVQEVRMSCESRAREDRRQLYTRRELNSLKLLMSVDDICSNWTGNEAGSYGPDAGSYVVRIQKTIILESVNRTVHVRGNRYQVENHASGTQLPIIQLEALDGLDQGPAIGVNNETIQASMTSPDEFFSGSINIAMNRGVGNFSRVVGFGTEGMYQCVIAFSEESLEPFTADVHVRGCKLGEVAAADGMICEPCTSDTYNLGEEDEPGCHPCPENGKCASHVILPKKGYWHRTPCSTHMQKCLSPETCDFKERDDQLAKATEGLERCAFDERGTEVYAQAQCKEGHGGPLCGSCEANYGRLYTFLCQQCFSKFASVAMVFLSFLVLLGLTSITVRGSLVSSMATISTIQPSTSQSGPLPASCPSVPINEQMVEMIVTGVVPPEVIHPSMAHAPNPDPDQLAKETELAQWKAIELFKITLNFLQVTAVAISINVEWTGPAMVLFKSAEFVGGVTSEAILHSVDCLVSENASVERSIASTLIDLSIPLAAGCAYAIYWLVDKAKHKTTQEACLKKTVLSFLAVFYISYISLTKTLVKILTCIEVHDSLTVGVDRTTDVWAADTSVRCYHGSHAVLACVFGWPLLFIFVFGFPLIIACLIIKNVHNDYKEGWIYEVSGFMYRSYSKRFVFWESIILLRKSILAIVVVLSYPLGINLQHVLAVFVLAVALYFQTICRPYRKEFNDLNELENLSVLVSLLTFISSMFFGDEGISDAVRILVSVGIFIGNLTLLFTLLYFIAIFTALYLRAVLDAENVPYKADGGTWHIIMVYLVDYVAQLAVEAVFDWVHGGDPAADSTPPTRSAT